MAASDAGSAASGIPEADNCSEIRLLLSALVDNEATPEEAVRAKNHILVCPNCASHLAFLRLTGRALSQVPEMLPSPSLSARIAAATYDKPTLGERIAAWLRPAPVRVALGTAMAAGLALVFIVPRLGEEVAVNTPSPAAENAPTPAETKAALEKISPGTAKAPASTAPKSAAAAPKPQSKPQTAAAPPALSAPSAKPRPAVAQAPVTASAPPVRRPAPVAVASVTRRENLALMGREAASAAAIIRNARTEPRIDRGIMRAPAGIGLKKPGTGSITLSRSGYDRAADTERVLKPRVSEGAGRVAQLPTASAVAPTLAPLPTGNTSAPAPEAVTDRIASRAPVSSTAVSVAAAASTAAMPEKIQIRLNSRPKNADMILTAGADSRAGVLSANDRYAIGVGNPAQIRITSAPVK